MSTDDLRQPLIAGLEAYQGLDAAEEKMRQDMLAFVRRRPDCFERALAEGHMTASAWVVNPAHTEVVMMHHCKLGIWLQPGGHADGDQNLLQVALREVEEETGLLARPVSTDIYDVDIHEIPANSKTPAHLHYDVRFLLEVDPTVQSLCINEESNDLAWVPMEAVVLRNSDRSVLRLAEKI